MIVEVFSCAGELKNMSDNENDEMNPRPRQRRRVALEDDDDDDNDEEDVTPPLTINFAATSMDHGYHLPPPPSLQPGIS